MKFHEDLARDRVSSALQEGLTSQLVARSKTRKSKVGLISRIKSMLEGAISLLEKLENAQSKKSDLHQKLVNR